MERSFSMSSIVDRVRAAGIVGAGGAGFPSYIKLSARARTIIANGAECEPLLRVDQQAARLYARRLVRGLSIAAEAVGAEEAIVGIKYKHHETIAAVEAAAIGTGVRVERLQDFYPAGDEFNLVYEVTGRIIPEGGRPTDVGCVVQNVITLIQIADAVEEEKPVTARFITIAGAVREPITVEAPIGTPATFCIEAAGGSTEPDFVVIDGGPMMGRFVDPRSATVTKRTSGFIVLPRAHPYVERRLRPPDVAQHVARAACDQCNLCTEFCPRYLLGHRCRPSRTMRAGLSAQPIPDDLLTAALCCECGLCSLWACPIPLPVREMMAQTRLALRKHDVRSPFRNTEVERSPFLDNRKVPVAALVEKLGLAPYDLPAPIQGMPLRPGRIVLELDAHAGAPALPVKAAGDAVRAGEVVAESPPDAIGSRYHAPIDGKVLRVTSRSIELGL
jgi:Na+-translocating ferredoxin:NAD+ oxidoreductase RnfC subunit